MAGSGAITPPFRIGIFREELEDGLPEGARAPPRCPPYFLAVISR
jgi:hypothetical protein